ncbi:Dipeptidase [Granulicatella balaenopterae]|uniref:membrane dipeptidase n=1 Tax=Granulicatella balaenopterae TaxID=137733 RepID=A0A1H9N2E0_9LACT|nr:C69 family dipeptidase [Granulicatella balaenopterae]SER29937.1 Dipeptidase [Granulicatella balaenopterae]
MKKSSKTLLSVLGICALAVPTQTVMACTGFVIGKDLTEDGSTIYGRTEDLEPNHNKTFVVHPSTKNKVGSLLQDLSNGFTYPLPAVSYKFTSIPDVTPEYGVYDEAGFNEYGVSISATVSAKANKQIRGNQKKGIVGVDPYVADGLAESNMTTLVLPRVKSAREGIEFIAKVVEEKGSAEGNIVVLADHDEIWYMEIYSGHQYAAIKFPDDKFAVFPNTFYLGTLNEFKDEDKIVSKDLEKVAKEAGTYKETNGHFNVSQSYNPPMRDSNRSRTWSGIKSLNPDATVQYDDEYFELLQDSPKKLTLRDAFNLQRNRFEGTKYIPLDQAELDDKGNPIGRDNDSDVYKYPISNPNVMEAHVFQIKKELPKDVGGVLWLSVGTSQNSPYLPYFGNITETYEAYQNTSEEYNANSWYWVASDINNMAMKHTDLFGKTVRNMWEAKEDQWMKEQPALIQQQIDLANDPAKASEVATNDSLARAKEVFGEMKDLEKEMQEKIAESEKPEEPETPVKQGWDGDYYYKDGEKVTSKWIYDNDYKAWFYLKADGTYARDEWVGGYFLTQYGQMGSNGWYYDNGNWYYLHADGSYAHDEWVSGYFLTQYGQMAKGGWYYDKGDWYYIHEDGTYAHDEWVSGYFLTQYGQMAKDGWYYDNGHWYYIYKDGHYARNEKIDGYKLGKWGALIN